MTISIPSTLMLPGSCNMDPNNFPFIQTLIKFCSNRTHAQYNISINFFLLRRFFFNPDNMRYNVQVDIKTKLHKVTLELKNF